MIWPPSSPSVLAALVRQNLLTRAEQPDGSVRYGMLETIREYGLERLEACGEADAVRGRHLAWCLTLAEQAAPTMFTAGEAASLRRLDQEDGNLRAALAWALAPQRGPELESGLRLAGAPADTWYLGGRVSEGRAWLERAIAAGRDRPPTRGRAAGHVGASRIAQAQGAVAEAVAHGEAGLAMA